jgi:hypothetical protein
MATKNGATKVSATGKLPNPWGSSLDKLKEWDPEGAELLLQVGTDPWTSGVLPRKDVELISLALHCACTNLDETGTRRHVRAALDAGATRDEILMIFKCSFGPAVHSCSLMRCALSGSGTRLGTRSTSSPLAGPINSSPSQPVPTKAASSLRDLWSCSASPWMRPLRTCMRPAHAGTSRGRSRRARPRKRS